MEAGDEIMGREMKLEEVRNDFHNQVLKLRAIERLLDSSDFEIAFRKATEPQRDVLQVMLKSQAVTCVRRWVQDLIEEPLGVKSFRTLRELAKWANVPRYSRLNRDQLIRSLEKKRDLQSKGQ